MNAVLRFPHRVCSASLSEHKDTGTSASVGLCRRLKHGYPPVNRGSKTQQSLLSDRD